MIKNISKITLYVNDQEQAKRFWVDKLEFVVTMESRLGTIKWLEVAPSNVASTSFVLYSKQQMQEENPEVSLSHPSIILSTPNIDTTYEKMKANKIKVDQLIKLPYGKMFSFKDQDGNDYLVREN
ncbi:VOC family protein [Oscillospiraceae bacterium PP1C4]